MIIVTLLFNGNGPKNKSRRFQTETVTSKSPHVNEVVKIVYSLRVLHSNLHAVLVFAFKPWALCNYTQQTEKLVTMKKE